MNKILLSFVIIASFLSCNKSSDRSYENIKNDKLYIEYYKAFIESSRQALKFDNNKIDEELKACGLYNNNGSVCDPFPPDCNFSNETIQWRNTACKVFTTSKAVKEKYNLTDSEFLKILNIHIDENYEIN